MHHCLYGIVTKRLMAGMKIRVPKILCWRISSRFNSTFDQFLMQDFGIQILRSHAKIEVEHGRHHP